MVIEHHFKIEAKFCCTCGQTLKWKEKPGVFLSGDKIVALCEACTLQVVDLFEILNSGGMIIKDHEKNNEVENVNP